MKANDEDDQQEILIVHDQLDLIIPRKKTYKKVNMDILIYDITSNYLKDNVNTNLGEVLKECLCDDEYFINMRGICCC